MSTYTVSDATGRTVSEAGPDTLKRFLDEADGRVELRRDDWPDRAVAARPEGAGWQVEIIEPGRTLTARTPNADATLDVMRSWAEEDGWWGEAFSWQPAEAS